MLLLVIYLFLGRSTELLEKLRFTQVSLCLRTKSETLIGSTQFLGLRDLCFRIWAQSKTWTRTSQLKAWTDQPATAMLATFWTVNMWYKLFSYAGNWNFILLTFSTEIHAFLSNLKCFGAKVGYYISSIQHWPKYTKFYYCETTKKFESYWHYVSFDWFYTCSVYRYALYLLGSCLNNFLRFCMEDKYRVPCNAPKTKQNSILRKSDSPWLENGKLCPLCAMESLDYQLGCPMNESGGQDATPNYIPWKRKAKHKAHICSIQLFLT